MRTQERERVTFRSRLVLELEWGLLSSHEQKHGATHQAVPLQKRKKNKPRVEGVCESRENAHVNGGRPAHRRVVQLYTDVDVQRVLLLCLDEGPGELVVDEPILRCTSGLTRGN
jgi:hypothetical protein